MTLRIRKKLKDYKPYLPCDYLRPLKVEEGARPIFWQTERNQ